MATIRQRANRWQCIVKRKGYPLQVRTFDLKKDAEKWARQQESKIDTEQWVERTEVEQTTLLEILDRYAKEVTPTKRGTRAEFHRIDQFKRSTLAIQSLAAITATSIAAWRNSRLNEVSSGTVLRELCLLSHVFAVAIREWGYGLQSNPVSMVKKPSPGKARDRILTSDQREVNRPGFSRHLVAG